MMELETIPAIIRLLPDYDWFFFNEIECKKGPTRISKDPYNPEKKENLFNRKGGGVGGYGVGFWMFDGYKLKVSGKKERPEESSSSLKTWGQTYWRMKLPGTFPI